MAVVLIFAETQNDGQLRKAALHALTAGKALAQALGGQLHAAVLAPHAEGAAEEVKGYGVAQVHAASAACFAHNLAEACAPALAQLAQSIGARFIGGAATAAGRDILPRMAARLQAAMASDIMSFEVEGGEVTWTRPMWAGSVLAKVALGTPTQVFSIRTTEFAPAEKTGEAGVVKVFVPNLPATLPSRIHAFIAVKSIRPELTEAKVVVSGGRGTRGDFGPLEALADSMGGAVGASRAACDAGWMPNDLQVGQTGKVVAPQLYIAAGISGAIQHLAGMKGSKTIVAINKDAEAPIFQVADYGLVADMHDVLPKLRQAIEALK
ncbi:MAG: electron transfer flavoprotein subunit alpha/FixB family protein [Proteobacteria bacterium]|nr:electron transfer flavoprotein subunit alpha/FixB family protein [Cystobacterineae bacterium]MCL2259370.1 electron transfer flavoprotein subunit alpha/FixB family protein [Cystobacterineae bacterium]MCL2314408.1 electron transfer flavoprotein subunit alpha/FixB family protein [Pseudomonadota bacterium]